MGELITDKRYEVRLAQKGEIERQKEIWKLCFGDSDEYIDFFYTNLYKADAAMVLLQDEEISAMLTMIPIKIVAPDNQSLSSTMLYAIATHPEYRHRGFATQLIAFTHRYLEAEKSKFSVLVPADKQLFEFYRKLGYTEAFYIRELQITLENFSGLIKGVACTFASITPEEYNRRRNKLLSGHLYISYSNKEIAYQKKLSVQSGADIYGIDIEKVEGCVAIERISADKVFIREILIPDEFLTMAVKNITKLIPAQEYVLRMPAFCGGQMGGLIRPLGMVRVNGENEYKISHKELGYLGFAFD